MSTDPTNRTGFYWDERCFWHSGGNYALTLPVGGYVQPLAAGGLPESPETKRRLKNLLDVSGLTSELHVSSAPEASREDLLRVHPASYLDEFKAMSDAGGGELGLRTPFGRGGYEIAALSGRAGDDGACGHHGRPGRQRLCPVAPPGHHCLPDWPNGFCLMANIAIAVEAAKARGEAPRVAVLDWDVHHGNGTEHIFYDRDDVLTISIHQENNYPLDTGALADRGRDAGEGYNINIPCRPAWVMSATWRCWTGSSRRRWRTTSPTSSSSPAASTPGSMIPSHACAARWRPTAR